ncbi:GMC family oxidoreductase [Brevundimonas sp. 2R-24]|uniref:GMC family oxidoreductase n=1 Tax=Peiella sedimenti TaxID=3061083 RepID=A0ABT8SLE3_9CAUL|nr:GMC family oxidoreductase [Caulobacteraceae bacterium XZ-24]
MPVADARSLPDATRIEGDIVIIGGGIAGLSIAHELAGTNARVVLLESGGPEPDREIQSLYDGGCVISGPGNRDWNFTEYLGTSRVRALGGSGHVWGGKCGPLDAIDFAERSWRPLSGWPFGRAELKPWYDRACDRLRLPRFPADDGLPEGQALEPVTDHQGPLRSSPRAYSPVSGRADPAAFAAFRDAPGRAENIHIHTHANVTGIRLKPDGAVDHLEVRCLTGTRHVACGRLYILATGGIENARLMLASNADRPEGVGNATGWVGRCFQGHCTISTADADPRGDAEVAFTTDRDLSLYDNQPRDRAHAVFVLSPEAQQGLGVGNCTLTLSLRPKAAAAAGSTRAAVEQTASAIEGPVPRRLDYFFMSEEAPNPDSRITLSERTDALGQPQAHLEWRYTQTDWDSLTGSAAGFARALGAQGLGRLCWPVEPETLIAAFGPSRHHMGTTRMSVDPAKGVVDADCRVHDTPNLYIAGSSVFPTSGLVNPTLTLTALAIRLADHLKNQLGIAR